MDSKQTPLGQIWARGLDRTDARVVFEEWYDRFVSAVVGKTKRATVDKCMKGGAGLYVMDV